MRVVPFNLDDAQKAGRFAKTLFDARNIGLYAPDQRLIITNGTKIFAQAAVIGAIYFVPADTKSSKAIAILAKENGFTVHHVDIHEPISTFTGSLF